MARPQSILTRIPPSVRRSLRVNILPPVLRFTRRLSGGGVTVPPMRRYQLDAHETFAGYHDVAPLSEDGGALLAHATIVARRSPRPADEAIVGYFDRESAEFVEVSRTRLWCWQLGARLRWWPGSRRSLGFNTLAGREPSFCVADRPGRLDRVSPHPLFDVSADGRVGLALNFGRLARARPGYGYPALPDPFAGEWLPSGDGVAIVSLEAGRIAEFVSLAAIAALEPVTSAQTFHYLNSGFLNPAGTRFAVLHKRLPRPEQTSPWEVRAVVGGCDGTDLHVVPLPGAASHCRWMDDRRIAYTIASAPFGRSQTYFLYDACGRSLQPLHPSAPEVDGHPSFDARTGLWVTDSYPDLYGEQAIHLLEPDGSRTLLARLRAAAAYRGEWRCDLHPRWGHDASRGAVIVVDSTHEGSRAVYELGLRQTP